MKKFVAVAEEYVRTMEIWDVMSLKFCLCAMGVMIGAALPKKVRKPVFFGALAVFSATYIPLVMKFLKLLFTCDDLREEEY